MNLEPLACKTGALLQGPAHPVLLPEANWEGATLHMCSVLPDPNLLKPYVAGSCGCGFQVPAKSLKTPEATAAASPHFSSGLGGMCS